MAKINWTDVATFLGLPHYPNRVGPFGQKGIIVGDLGGQLVTVGPAKAQRANAVGIIVQSRPILDADRLQEALETDWAVRKALGKEGEARVNLRAMLHIGRENTALIWPIGLRPPSAEKIAALARAVADVIARTVGEMEPQCKSCGRPDAPIMLVNNTPMHVCEPCAEALQAQGSLAAQAYAQKRPNLPLGLLFGVGAGLVSALAWGVLSLLTERIFMIVAVGIGLFVGWALHRGMGKFTWVGQVAAALITLGSVLLGDLLYITFLLMREGADLLNAFLAVLFNLDIVFSESDIWVSLFFGLLGALYIFYRYRKPRVGIVVEPLTST
jgi:hypothetical protein